MRRTALLMYCGNFFFNFSLSMTMILIPLYLIHLDYSAVMIGLIISTQGIFQILLRLFGGLVSDQVGEKRVLWFSFGALATGSMIFAGAETLPALFVAQLLIGASRSVYWAASQSYASRVNPLHASTVLGHLSSVVNAGNILGFFSGGLLSSLFGYQVAFSVCSGLAAAAFAVSMFLPLLERKQGSRTLRAILEPIPIILRNRIFYLAGIAAFAAALPLALLASFYPIYFQQLGYSDTTVGFLASVRPMGSIVMGVLIGSILARFSQQIMFAVGLLGTGLLIMVTPLLQSIWSLILLILAIGVIHQIQNIIYQTIAAENSADNHRAVALSIPGHFWAAAHLTVPSIFGIIVSSLGMREAFFIGGGFLILLGLNTKIFYRYLSSSDSIENEKPNTARS
jgi:MFS family permease